MDIQKAPVRIEKRPLGIEPQIGQLSEQLRPVWGRRFAEWLDDVGVLPAAKLLNDGFSGGS